MNLTFLDGRDAFPCVPNCAARGGGRGGTRPHPVQGFSARDFSLGNSLPKEISPFEMLNPSHRRQSALPSPTPFSLRGLTSAVGGSCRGGRTCLPVRRCTGRPSKSARSAWDRPRMSNADSAEKPPVFGSHSRRVENLREFYALKFDIADFVPHPRSLCLAMETVDAEPGASGLQKA
jgi:hypothetical protein